MAEALTPGQEAVQNVYRQMFYIGLITSLGVIAMGTLNPTIAYYFTFMVGALAMAWSAWQRRKVLKHGR